MDKRYQVFLSSTYADLQQERQKVIQTLMEMDCIPAGMELFPAADEEQWEFIKRIIDDCDYYLLIIGGRYGSLSPEGISYTEKEYEYAISLNLKVLVFLHESPSEIPVSKSDVDPALRVKLDAFRARCSENRLVKFWHSADELPGLVALSLTKAIKLYPAVGWVRASSVGNDELLTDLNALRKENEQLRKDMPELKPRATWGDVLTLASMDETHNVTLEYQLIGSSRESRETVSATWAEIFGAVAPYLVGFPSDISVARSLGVELCRMRHTSSPHWTRVPMAEFHTIRTQFCALDLVNVTYQQSTDGKMGLFWSLTERGTQAMMELRTVKAQTNEAAESKV